MKNYLNFLFKINKLEVLKKLAVKRSSFSQFKSLLNSWQKTNPQLSIY